MYPNYLDLESSNGKKIIVWPIPYEATASFGKGTKNGPEAILKASYEIETWDEEMGLDLADLASFETWPYFRAPVSGPEQVYQEMLFYLEDHFHPESDFILTLGGEHSLALAPITFYQRKYQELVVLQIDAHADLRTSYQDSQYSHACVMSRIKDLNLPLVQLGIRSLSKEESRLISKLSASDNLIYFAWDLPDPELAAERVRLFIGDRPLYVSFDADGLDPSIMPGTGTPEPGGISYSWLNRFWPSLMRDINFLGMDFCELAPLPGAGLVSETVAVKCINKILLSYLSSIQGRFS